ncbi:MAG: bifunctional oligoribonuclease/PAP phosphatase NrnA [Pyramidobacter sp.]|nr:bifunctional oligoribonuclease/PAP phosphatase NrnA [Pyramidobacter sp.]
MTEPASELRQIAAVLKKEPRWRIICHIKPDGDTLGCGSALMTAALLLGKDAVWGGADPMPPLYRFLPHAAEYEQVNSVPDDGRCLIAVDVSTRDRGLSAADVRISIDHHKDNEGFAREVNWIVPEAAAVGELIFELVQQLGCGLTLAIAQALYVSIATDCGWFRFSNTTANTLRVASELVKAGAVPHEIDELLDYNDSLAKMRLWGRCLSRAEKAGSRSVISWVSHDDFRETGALEADTEGLVNMLTHAAGTDMTVLVSETARGLRCSFRSRGSLAANELAAKWNGGGHRYAAGCTIEAALEAGLDMIRKELERV